MKVRFWHSDKPRERVLANAYMEGVRIGGKDECDLRRLGSDFTPDCECAVMVGVKSRDLYQAHAKLGIRVIYLDKGYSRHSKQEMRGWEYWRVAVNGHHPTRHFHMNWKPDRAAKQGWTFQPWRKSGAHIVIAGSSEKYHNFYGLKHPNDWASKLQKELRSLSRRPVIYRPKPSWKDAEPIDGAAFSHGEESIVDTLRGAHAMITHGSNACFEAMQMGVPTIVLGDAVAKPISSTSVDDIENPRLASDDKRAAVFNFLAYQQWTEVEMASGEAWATIRPMIYA